MNEQLFVHRSERQGWFSWSTTQLNILCMVIVKLIHVLTIADMTNVLNRKPRLLYLFPSKIRKSPSVVTSPPIALWKRKCKFPNNNNLSRKYCFLDFFCFIGVLRWFEHYFSYISATVHLFMILGKPQQGLPCKHTPYDRCKRGLNPGSLF